MNSKRCAVAILFIVVVLVACQPNPIVETVEVTRIVTETNVVAGEPVEVTRVETVVETITVVETVKPSPTPAGSKDLVVCMRVEPDSLYPPSFNPNQKSVVRAALFTNYYTTLSFGYQADGLEKIPSLADGDAQIVTVTVAPGEKVFTAANEVAVWDEGVTVTNAAGEAVTFAGNPVTMAQLVVDFTMRPTVWADGTPVSADDSVYSFELYSDPDTPTTRYVVERTASYEATGDHTVRWTGLPGFMDSTYFINFFKPLPRHLWGHLSAADLVVAEESSRLPIGDGPFRIVEWVPGDHILTEKNEFYYRADEGLPYLDSVTFKFLSDTNQLLAQMLSGACDTSLGLNASHAPFLLEAEAEGLLNLHVKSSAMFEHIIFGINSSDGFGDGIGRPDWFEDARVRQAMVMCTNRQAMLDTILFGRSDIAHSYVSIIHPLYPTGELTEWPYDVAAANALLDEVGYIDTDGDGIREDPATGTPFAVTLLTSSGMAARRLSGQIFQQNMLDCGINISLSYAPASELVANTADAPVAGRRFDLLEFSWGTGSTPACDLYLSTEIPGPAEETIPGHYDPDQTYAGFGGRNYSGWINEQYDQACLQAINALPGTPEYEIGHKEAQRIFAEQVPVIPLVQLVDLEASRPEVVNFDLDPTESAYYNIYEFDIQR